MPKKFFLATGVLCAVAYLFSGQRPPRAPARPIAVAGHQGFLRDAALEQRVRSAFIAAPLSFEENVGQTDPRVKFYARGSNYALFLTPEEAALNIHTPHAREKRPPQLAPEGLGWADAMAASAWVRVEFAGSNPAARLAGLDPQSGTINYIKGNDASRWRRDVPHFGRVRYEGLYAGIDAVFYGDRRQMEFDFVVAPGGDPSAIRMHVEGAGSVELTREGGLAARTAAGVVTLLAPKLYQQRDGSRQEIAGRYVWRAPGELGFEVASFDHSQSLVIDPATNVNQGKAWSSAATQIAAEQTGHRRPGYGIIPNSPPPTGGSVELSTLLGGSSDDSIQAMAIGATSGHVYVAGYTDSSDFPLVGGEFQDFFAGSLANNSCFIPQFPCGDAFVAEFDVSTISAPKLVNTTYLGGSGDDVAWGLALDANDNVYLAGETDSGDFPVNSTITGAETFAPVGSCTTSGTQRPCHHVFFVELNPTLSTLMYSTYLAGTDDDEGYAVAVDSTGLAFVTGVAGPNFLPPCDCTRLQPNYAGGGDAFMAVINPTVNGANSLEFVTYLGGDGTDIGFSIAVDSNDDVFIGGVTFSTNGNINFPTTTQIGAGNVDNVACGPGGFFACGDGFIVEIAPPGSTLTYGTLLSGGGADQVNAIAITTDPTTGNPVVYATGQTQSSNFQPVAVYAATATPFQANLSGGYDAFVVKFPVVNGGTISYATYLGGGNDDMGLGIAIDANGDAFVSGSTQSYTNCDCTPFPVAGFMPLQSTFNAGASFNNTTSFVSVVNPTGTNLLFSTFYGGTFDLLGNAPNDFGNAIALDTTGRIYLGGRTTSLTTPDNSQGLCLINQVPGANVDTNQNADNNGFLVIINPTSGASACFSPALVTGGTPLAFAYTPTLQNMTNGQTQTLTIYNQGSASLTNAISFAGTSPADFPENDNCATVNGGGSSCQINVNFKPTAATGTVTVAESATLNITNNANCPASAPCTVALMGTGLPIGTVSLAPAPPTAPTNPYTFPGTTVVGTATAAQEFLLTNTSTTSYVDVSGVALGGTNPGEFRFVGDTCTGQQLPANGGTCFVLVAFAPTTTPPGARSATLMVTDDATTNPTFGLSGTSVLPPPVASIPPLSLTFGPQVQGTTSAAQMVTITNSAAAGSANLTVTQPLTFTGANAGDFSASGCITPVAPAGGTCTVSVTFAPLAGATGSRTATLQIADNAANSPQTIGVSGTDLALPTVTVSGAVTFPAQVLMTQSGPMSVTLTNTSATSALTLTSVALNGGNMGDFAIASNGCGSSLAAGANCVVSLTFTPTATGARTTTLQFTDNASGTPASPQSVTINGTGVNPATLTPQPTVTFATPQALNTPSAPMAATLMNPNTVAMPVTSVAASGDFAVVPPNPCGASVAATSSCTINVVFTPTAVGPRNGVLTVVDAFGTQTTNLTGTGATPPAVTLSPATSVGTPFNFGTQAVGVTSAAMSFTVTNTGGTPLSISAIAPTGDFGETDNCIATSPLAANGGSCTIMVTFTPGIGGSLTGSIVIVDNAANSPQSIYLAGTGSGNVPGFDLSAPLFFGAVLEGNTSTPQTITITNSGGATLVINSVTATPEFGIPSNNCGSVLVGRNCMISVNFTPNATGTQTGTLTIVDNAPGSPHTISLSGIGATINIAPPAGQTTTATVTPGDTATYPLNINSTPGLVVTLNLSCASPAPYTICTVSPSQVTLGGPTPPSVTVTVQTNCNPALIFRPTGGSPPILPAPFAGLWVGTLVLFVLLRRVMPKPWLARAAPAVLLMLLVVTWAGCANNPAPAIPGSPTTPAGIYSVTVTANGMNVTKQLMLTLRVI